MNAQLIRARFPAELCRLKQFCLWRYESDGRGGKPTKVPRTRHGKKLSTRRPSDWCTLDDALAAHEAGGFDGIGFVFIDGGGLFGVDLDNCLDESGRLKPWAREILGLFDGCYREISPSGRGIKIFAKGNLSLSAGTGVKRPVGDGAAEIYTTGRYFTVTGEHGEGELLDATEAGNALIAHLEPGAAASEGPGAADASTLERCRASLVALPKSIEGEDGSGAIFHCACHILRYGLDGAVGYELLRWYGLNRSEPPWSEAEMRHKWQDAQREVMRKREFGTAADLGFGPDGLPFSLDVWESNDFLDADFPQHYLILLSEAIDVD